METFRLTDDCSNSKATCCNPNISESKSVRVKESAHAGPNDLWSNSLDCSKSGGVVVG